MNNALARVEPSTAVAMNTLFPGPQEWGIIKEHAGMLVKSGFLPRGIDTAEKAIAIILKGREMGIPPMQAFAHIAIVEGKPTMSAELMRSQIFRLVPGAVFEILELSNQGCTIRAGRPGRKTTDFSWGPDEARAAGLLGKQNWQRYPKAMYLARVTAEAARALFADALMGVSYTHEELAPDVELDDDERPIEGAKKPGPAAKPAPAAAAPKTEPAPAAPPAAKKGHPFDVENEAHKGTVVQILRKREVPEGWWGAILGAMKGKFFSELETVIGEVGDLMEAEEATNKDAAMEAEYVESAQQ